MNQTQQESKPAWLTTKQVAARFGVRVNTIIRWDRDGKFPNTKRTPGGHRRYRRDDVEALELGSIDD